MKALFIGALVILLILGVVAGFQRIEINDITDQLFQIKSDFETTKSRLETSENDFNETKTKLTATELLLTIIKDELNDSKTELNTTQTKLTNTEIKLATTESQLETTKYQLDMSEEEQKQMQIQYANFREEINIRFGQEENCQEFITPNNDLVTNKAKEIAGNYSEDGSERWRDYYQLYRWVINNIEYSNDSYLPYIPLSLGDNLVWKAECWRMPEETLKDKAGDCEDMALLLASLMLSYNQHIYGVWLIGISNEESGHLAVAYPVVDNELVIIDPAGNYHTGYPNGRFSSVYVSKSISDWILHWRDKIPNAEIDSVFSDNFFHEFSNTEEFITWVKER